MLCTVDGGPNYGLPPTRLPGLDPADAVGRLEVSEGEERGGGGAERSKQRPKEAGQRTQWDGVGWRVLCVVLRASSSSVGRVPLACVRVCVRVLALGCWEVCQVRSGQVRQPVVGLGWGEGEQQ